MIAKARAVLPLALIVCASLAALLLKGAVEWSTDLLVSGAAGLAGRMKSGGPTEEDDREGVRRKGRRSRRMSWQHATHTAARLSSPYGSAPAWLFAEE